MKLKRTIKFLFQRLTRGWDDSDTWNLDYSVSKLILPRLRRFKELHNGYPADLTEEQFQADLDAMIAAFEFAGSEERWEASPEEFRKHQKGIDLFAHYFYTLWW